MAIRLKWQQTNDDRDQYDNAWLASGIRFVKHVKRQDLFNRVAANRALVPDVRRGLQESQLKSLPLTASALSLGAFLRITVVALLHATLCLLLGPSLVLASNEAYHRCAKEQESKLKLEYCTAVIQAGDPAQLAWAFIYRGNAYYNLNDYDHAMKDYDNAVTANPNLPDAYCSRARSYRKSKQYTRAIQDLDQAILLNPLSHEGFHFRAMVRQQMGQYELAIADENRAIELKPHFAEGFRGRCSDFARALQDCDQAIKLEPNSSNYSVRAWVWVREGDLDAAVTDASVALSIDPKNAGAYSVRAWARFGKGNFEDAATDCTKVISLSSTDSATRAKALCQYLNKRYEEAVLAGKKVIHEDPRNAEDALLQNLLQKARAEIRR